MAPASGFVLRAAGEPSIYVAGDIDLVRRGAAALDVQRPDIVVVNAGGARFVEGDPIVMTADDVVALTRHIPGTPVVAVHWTRSTTVSRAAKTCAPGCAPRGSRTASACLRTAMWPSARTAP